MFLLLPQTEDERLEAMYAFEDRAYLGWEDPGNDALDRSPEHIDRLTDVMCAEDLSTIDEDGWVR
jgi:hypothetical protein